MKTLIVSEITRPSLEIEAIKQDDGSLLPGSQYWAAVDFVTDLNKNDVVGHHDCLHLKFGNLLKQM